VSGRFVHPYWLSIKFDHVHDFDGVVCVLFGEELYETVALVHQGHSVFGHVDIDHRACLNKQFPHQGLVDLLVKSTHVDRRILISFGDRTSSHGDVLESVVAVKR